MEKEFGHLSREEVKRVYSSLHEYNLEAEDLHQAARESDKLGSVVIPWVEYYEMPFLRHLALYLLVLGVDEELKEISLADDPIAAFLNFFIDGEYDFSDEPEDFDDDEKQVITAMVMALMGQIESFKQFSQSLSGLIDRVRQGDEDALFRAITVDRTVVACPTIVRHISLAQARNDEAFMDKLAKAITRTKPVRPKPQFDDMRFMLEAVVEVEGIEAFTTVQLEDILANDLELYPNDSDYSSRAFRKMIQKRNKMVGT